MGRKAEKIDWETLERFASFLEGLHKSTSRIMELLNSADDNAPQIVSTNYTTALRGLDYVDKFVRGLAKEAATQLPRHDLDALLAEEEAKRESIANQAAEANRKAKSRRNGKKD